MSAPFKRTETPGTNRSAFYNLNALMPYIWEFRGRVLFALGCLLISKLATVGIPITLKNIVDHLDNNITTTIVLPMALLMAYGVLRLAGTFFNELRDVLFTRVRYRAMRRLTIRTLEHLHNLSLRFHLERKTGALSSDLQRGAASLSTLLNSFKTAS